VARRSTHFFSSGGRMEGRALPSFPPYLLPLSSLSLSIMRALSLLSKDIALPFSFRSLLLPQPTLPPSLPFFPFLVWTPRRSTLDLYSASQGHAQHSVPSLPPSLSPSLPLLLTLTLCQSTLSGPLLKSSTPSSPGGAPSLSESMVCMPLLFVMRGREGGEGR